MRLNATETKLLTTYNSTEFGVPTTSSPPKYSWLGAAGVADTLPSGVTNQGGTSYAPLIARTLQTNGVAIPAAISTNTPYVNVNSSWLWENAGAASARQIEAGNAARRALEAGGPALGEEEEEEEGGGGGGCSGMNACAASIHLHPGVIDWSEGGEGYAGCSAWTSYGNEHGAAGVSGEIEIYGHWQCQIVVPRVEMEIRLLILDPPVLSGGERRMTS